MTKNVSADSTEVIEEPVQEDAVLLLPISTVHPDPDQPRVAADDELSASIAERGVIQAVIVRGHPDVADEWMIVDGERRYHGAIAAGLKELPCRIRLDLEDPVERLSTQLAANTGKQLTPLEEGRAFKRLLEANPELSQATLAKKLGTARSTVGDRIRLADTPAPWLELIEAGELQLSHAPFIHPFASLPESVHRATVKALKEHWSWQNAQRDGRPIEVARFKDMVREAFKGSGKLYPLQRSKRSWDPQPEFAIGAHDKECDCGRIRVDLDGSGARDYCSNPGWWKPKADVAKKEREAKDRARRNSFDSRGKFPKGFKIEANLPAGAQTKPLSYAEATAKGYEILTNETGRWEMGQPRFGGEFELDKAFDPDALGLGPSEIFVTKDPATDSALIVTNAPTKVQLARESFANKIEKQREKVISSFKRRASKDDHAPIEGPPALIRSVLSALIRWDSASDIVIAGIVEGLEVPPALSSRALQKFGTMINKDKVREWALALPDVAILGLITSFAEIVSLGESSDQRLTPNERDDSADEPDGLARRLQDAGDDLARETMKKPVPWLKVPVAKDGTPYAECESCESIVPESELKKQDNQLVCRECIYEDEDDEEFGELATDSSEEDLEEAIT